MNEIVCISAGSKNDFWKAWRIYYEHPNSINKQIIQQRHVFGCLVHIRKDNKGSYDEICDDLWNHLQEGKLNDFKNFKTSEYTTGSTKSVGDVFGSLEGKHIFLRQLVPKHNIGQHEFYEFHIIDKDNTKVTILTRYSHNTSCDHKLISTTHKDPLSILKYNYIELKFSDRGLNLCFSNDLKERGSHWLKVIFLPKFQNLMLSSRKEDNKSTEKLKFTPVVDVIQYYKLYDEMKSKYASNLIKNWTENTDPKKFVYEDIGIATYLLLLWNNGNANVEKRESQKFVDLGCGNGLLVHILNSEGHQGVGLDMRKRKIWDTYDSNTILKEEVIIPTEDTTYPEADWLIGNHSDELTPWLPVLAKRSNDHCQYFVLPCCPYQLNGQKFQRQNSTLSTYQDFMYYVKGISEMCDFDTFIDRMRIPSTKRICLIGLRKTKSNEEIDAINDKITNFIRISCQSVCGGDSNSEQEVQANNELGSTTGLNFKIRESTERVRNCTKLEPNLIKDILQVVTNKLLECECKISIVKNDVPRTWNRGGKLKISNLVHAISDDSLKKLKNECKGLQTLLKNHHFLFQVSKGEVQFRSPEELQRMSDNLLSSDLGIKWKKRDCWFNDNHPDGCPLNENKCSYKHK
ncbi:hypothetical protein RUM43_005747 [Polyplax serrata]|uniref:tRNA (uracil-O(2)-)-methyltransferase n=1 Tax=Polyplax serrata TaxID=468196 RepID=A0AAN8S8R3_POLSC